MSQITQEILRQECDYNPTTGNLIWKRPGRKRVVGSIKTQEEAALAYNKAAIELYGEFANLNKVD